MKRLPLLVVCVIAFFSSNSQLDTSYGKRIKSVNAYVKTMDNQKIKATLLGVKGDLLLLTSSKGKQWQIPAENIQSFTLNRKNSTAKGALIGFAIGAATGMILGMSVGDDPAFNEPVYNRFPKLRFNLREDVPMSAEEKALAGAVGLGLSGAMIGVITASVLKKRFTIGGRKETFRDLQSEIMSTLVWKQPPCNCPQQVKQ